ncbi:MarR family winged helix-turn-helix transcriptional regulator [Thermomonospora umbrina]|uniref:DNA-binding MarR family transcriptional regulator n=1 Tax=Thermomonospora umbrina TaxID=111806 RepID=A0A3D9SRZ8_9ACTN|nr:MarR family transcriptional regulator [Thermomonospora umbrina]REE98712.1 DNA-binding MarR family transcriptional regulator [Thermomonospora umbrina]
MEMATAPARLRGTPSWLLNQAAVHAGRHVNEGFAAIGARRYHYSLLAALTEFGPASQAALGRRCGIDRSDVVATLNELAGRDLVRREPDPTDRRRNIIRITPAGADHLTHLDTVLARAQDAAMAPLSGPEREELVRLLTRLLEPAPRD